MNVEFFLYKIAVVLKIKYVLFCCFVQCAYFSCMLCLHDATFLNYRFNNIDDVYTVFENSTFGVIVS